jgi:hypothetical protein
MKVTQVDMAVVDLPMKEPWVMSKVQVDSVVALSSRYPRATLCLSIPHDETRRNDFSAGQ